MFRWILATLCTIMLSGQADRQEQPLQSPTQTQPATAPADAGSTLLRPVQTNILRSLLERSERPAPIRAEEPGRVGQGPGGEGAGLGPDGRPLLFDGTFLVERPGRLVREGGTAKFVFHADGNDSEARSMEILPNQLLEAMEREAEAGFSQFIISAEVTRYRDRNYLLLRKILRRVDHGNLGR